MSNILAPSLLAANPSCLAADVEAAGRGGAQTLHLDIMDGHFVPNLSFGPHIAAGLETSLPIDAHLMVTAPSYFAPLFIRAGAKSITVHAESEDTDSTISLLKSIRARGIKAAVAIKPKTPIEVLIPFVEHIDMALLMTVEPGYGGQSFIEGSLERIAAARAILKDMDLQIDGGVTLENVGSCLKAGANVIVAGSSVFGAADIEKRTREFMYILNSQSVILGVQRPNPAAETPAFDPVNPIVIPQSPIISPRHAVPDADNPVFSPVNRIPNNKSVIPEPEDPVPEPQDPAPDPENPVSGIQGATLNSGNHETVASGGVIVKNRITVEVLGQEYNLLSTEDPLYVRYIADVVDEELRKSAVDGRLSMLRASVLHCLRVTDRCEKAEDTTESLRTQLKSSLDEVQKLRLEVEELRRANLSLR